MKKEMMQSSTTTELAYSKCQERVRELSGELDIMSKIIKEKFGSQEQILFEKIDRELVEKKNELVKTTNKLNKFQEDFEKTRTQHKTFEKTIEKSIKVENDLRSQIEILTEARRQDEVKSVNLEIQIKQLENELCNDNIKYKSNENEISCLKEKLKTQQQEFQTRQIKFENTLKNKVSNFNEKSFSSILEIIHIIVQTLREDTIRDSSEDILKKVKIEMAKHFETHEDEEEYVEYVIEQAVLGLTQHKLNTTQEWKIHWFKNNADKREKLDISQKR